LQLTGAATVEQALARLAELTPLVIVKRGAEGAIAGLDGGVVQVPAIPVEVVDTTGAGDCFNAGFLYGYLRGASLETCLRAGNICGGLSTRPSEAGPRPLRRPRSRNTCAAIPRVCRSHCGESEQHSPL